MKQTENQKRIKAKKDLREDISIWLNAAAEKEVDFKWIGDNLVDLMTDAAWSVLMASIDVQEYLEKEGQLK